MLPHFSRNHDRRFPPTGNLVLSSLATSSLFIDLQSPF